MRARDGPPDGTTLLPVLTDAGLLDIAQLTDSAFPTGSYAHSLGLEWLCRQPSFNLEGIVRVRLCEQLACVELPIARGAHAASTATQLLALDRLMDVLTPVAELRAASRSMGRSFRRAAAKLRPGGITEKAEEHRVEHHPVVYGAVLRDWDLPLDAGLALYALHAVRQQLSAAQRLGLIGQTTLQELLHQLKGCALEAVAISKTVSTEGAGAFGPWFDIASAAHANLSSRLFLS